MNKKNNSRWKETEIRMESVLLALMKKHSFEKITVRMICEKAEVNRSTFYAHFEDIYDMMAKMEKTLHEELMNDFSSIDASDRQMFTPKTFEIFLNHIHKHQYFYRTLLATRTEFPIQEGLEQLRDQVVIPQCRKAGITSENEIMYYLVDFQAGFTNILRRWLDTGCHETSEQLAAVIKNCIPAVWYRRMMKE